MIKIVLMMASTVDGKIAKDKNHLANWTSKEDKKLFVKESKKHGVILMGENTFRTFPGPLPNRLNVVFSYNEKPRQIDNLKYVSGEPELVLKELKNMGYNSALLGGGANLNSLFLEKKLISEILISYEPKIFGNGLSIFSKSFDIDLKLLELKKISEQAFCARYKLIYS
jgi:dihydrofolate reductase